MRETLADFVRRVRQEKGFSTTDVERNSHGKISDSYVSRIENGYVKSVSLDKLEALANGLKVPAIEMFRASQQKDIPADRRQIFFEAFGGEDLPEQEIEEIERIVEVLIEQKRRRIKAEKLTDVGVNETLYLK